MEKGFNRQDDELEATELRLGLPGTQKPPVCGGTGGKRALGTDASEERSNPPKPTKSQVVGWPPVRSSFRRNVLESKKAEAAAPEKQTSTAAATATVAHFIKVSMDGAPFLRKVDLNVLKGYKDLRLALEAMFKCFEPTNGSADLSVTYEDKDGDWMLVGDVPWAMFTDSCRRLRIMKGSEARGLNPCQ